MGAIQIISHTAAKLKLVKTVMWYNIYTQRLVNNNVR